VLPRSDDHVAPGARLRVSAPGADARVPAQRALREDVEEPAHGVDWHLDLVEVFLDVQAPPVVVVARMADPVPPVGDAASDRLVALDER